jgi:DHA1 family bicyclomycin/chloramphenicol resistance-like MFS transporter
MTQHADRKFNTRIILILGCMTTLVPFSVDSYLPAVPEIAAYFNTTAATMAYSLTTFFAGFAVGQLVYGPLLDRFGRKIPLYYGLGISIIFTIACVLSWDEKAFMVFRFLQALGASAATVAAITMVRDYFSQDQSARIFSMLILVIGASPLLAPSIGSAISASLGWRWIFVFLSLLAFLLMMLITFFLPVRYKPDKEISLKLRDQTSRYISIIRNPQFLAYATAGAFSFASLFIYVAGSPIIFLDVFKVSPRVFGLIFALLSVGFIGGSQMNILVLRFFSSRQIFRAALFTQFAASLLFLAGAYNGWYGQTATLIFLFILLLCLGFVSPNAMALALEPFEGNLGSASALLGTIRIGIAGLASGSIGLFHTTGIAPIALMIAASISIAMIIFAAAIPGSLAFKMKWTAH